MVERLKDARKAKGKRDCFGGHLFVAFDTCCLAMTHMKNIIPSGGEVRRRLDVERLRSYSPIHLITLSAFHPLLTAGG